MRSAPRQPARLAPALQSLEGRVVLSVGLGAEPPASMPTVVRIAQVEFGASGVEIAGMVGRRPGFDGVDFSSARLSAWWSSFGGGRHSHKLSPFDGLDERVPFGPPAPGSDDARATSLTGDPTRGLLLGLARLGPSSAEGSQASQGESDPPPPRPMVQRPRGPISQPVVIEAESATTVGASNLAAPASAPALPAPASADPARPLAVTNMAAPTTVVTLGLGTSSTPPAGDRGGRATAAPRLGLRAVSAAGEPQASRDAPVPEADGSAEAAEEPAPIGSGVLEAFLPLDRAAVDRALGKVLGELDDLAAPFADPSSRLPIVVPVAAALAVAEAARRWRGRASLPGASAARPSRFSSLRGLA